MSSAAAEANHLRADGSLSLKVLLVYEDFETGLTARHTLDGIIQAFDAAADVQVNLWRFDLLVDPVLRGEAAEEANEAELVIVSLHGHEPLPSGAKSWLDEWFGRERKHESALVVLLDLDALHTPLAEEMLEKLNTATRRAGIEMFIHHGDAQLRWTSAVQDIQHRAETRTLLVDEILDERPSFRHWGINE